MILGIRCSNADYSFALLKGKKGAPQVVNVESVSFPKGYIRANTLRWLYQEVEDHLSRHEGISNFVTKGAESMAQKGLKVGVRSKSGDFGSSSFLFSS